MGWNLTLGMTFGIVMDLTHIFEIQCLFYFYRTSQFESATFQVPSSHMRLVATVLDRTTPESLEALSILPNYPFPSLPKSQTELQELSLTSAPIPHLGMAGCELFPYFKMSHLKLP